MIKRYAVTLTVNGRKKAATVIVHEGGQVDVSTPEALKITEQLLDGAKQGTSTTRMGKVSFILLKAEFKL